MPCNRPNSVQFSGVQSSHSCVTILINFRTFSSLQKETSTFQPSPSFPPSLPGQSLLLLVLGSRRLTLGLYKLAVLDISYKWTHTTSGLLWLAFFGLPVMF